MVGPGSLKDFGYTGEVMKPQFAEPSSGLQDGSQVINNSDIHHAVKIGLQTVQSVAIYHLFGFT